MPNIFKPKRSTTASSVPTTGNLSDGELAVNLTDRKIFVRNGASIVTVADSLVDGDKGDITVSSSGASWTIDSGVVTNAKLANVTTATIKGRATAGTGSPEDLTGTQATALLDTFTTSLKGLAPASGGGTANFLRADGTWAAPTASSITGTVTGTNSTDLVYGNMADNDQFRIRIGGTASDSGFVEIATADNGTEPIYVRQYSGVFTTLTRTATLLDASGNTSFPGSITGNTIVKSGGTSSQFLKADGSVDSNAYITSASVGNGTLTLNVSGTGLSGSQTFTANQSGNATFTVTSNATSANTASTIVARDASGNFTAGTITATLSGNATTATTATNQSGGTVSATTGAFSGIADFTGGSGANPAVRIRSGGNSWSEGFAVHPSSDNNFALAFFRTRTSFTDSTATWAIGNLGTNSTNNFGLLRNGLTGGAGIRADSIFDVTQAGVLRFGFNPTVGANAIWHAGNDGTGSGLDADLLDGQQGSYYQPASTALTTSTTFGGDVSGTYNAIVVADDSHTHDGRYFTETESDARYLGISAKAADSNLLDGIDSASFLRSDAADTFNSTLTYSGSSTALNFTSTAEVILADHSSNSTPVPFDIRKSGSTLSDSDSYGVLHLSRLNHNDAATTVGASLYFQLKDSAGTLREYAGISGQKTEAGAAGGRLQFFRYGRTSLGYWDANNLYVGTSGVWHSGNDGSGSGLDADLLDGQQGSYYQNAGNIDAGTLNDARLSYTELGRSPVGNFGQWEGHSAYNDFNTPPTYWGWTYLNGTTNAPNTSSAQWYRGRFSLGNAYGLGSDANDYWMEMAIPRYSQGGAPGNLWIRTCENGAEQSWYQVAATVSGNTSWHAGNDGAGSGLDADLLDGQQGTYYLNYNNLTNQPTIGNGTLTLNVSGTGLSGSQTFTANQTGNATFTVTSNATSANTASTIVARDASGNFTAGTITAALSGNATTATTATNVSGGSVSATTGTFSGNLTGTSNTYITFGPNSTWGKYSRFGGNGYQGDANTTSVSVTNGNLHIDAATSSATYLNYYAGTAGVAFGSGASATVAWMGPDGDLWKGASDNSGSKYWHASNDGSGSGLDADLLDGLNSSQFLRSDADTITSGYLQAEGFVGSGGALVITNPGGASFATATSSTTGYLKVTLPVSWTNTMMRMTIRCYEYATGYSFEVHCGGYNYAPSTSWISTFAYIIGDPSLAGGRNFNVRFGHDGTNCAIYIGESNSAWSYFQFGVTEFLAGYSAYAASSWHNGWSCSITPTLGTITATQSTNAVGEYVKGNVTWHAGNDGAGSTLDADLLDGQQGSYYTGAGNLSGTIPSAVLGNSSLFVGTTSIALNRASASQSLTGVNIDGSSGSCTGNAATATTLQTARTINGVSFNGSANITVTANTPNTLTLNTSGTGLSGSTTFNGGSATTFTVTSNATSANTASTIVARDASGNFSAGTITATLSGNSTTATNISGYSGTYWTSNNDGAGSGLDADLLDGISSASFLRNDTDSAVSTLGVEVSFYSNTVLESSSGDLATLEVYQGTAGEDAFMQFHVAGDYAAYFGLKGDINDFAVGGWSMGATYYRLWHAGNDGSGSGLDADLLDGLNAASTNTASTIVARDASGNFSAGTITASLSGSSTSCSGNAATATTLQTARTINGVSFNGSANITVTANTPNTLTLNTSGTGLSGSATFNGGSATTFTVTSNATSANTASTIVARDASGNFSAGTITASLSGSSTSCSGNAATATTLQTTRTIWGQNFNGSANVSGALTGVTDITASGSVTATGNVAVDGAFRAESSNSTERFEIYYNETTDSLDFDYLTA